MKSTAHAYIYVYGNYLFISIISIISCSYLVSHMYYAFLLPHPKEEKKNCIIQYPYMTQGKCIASFHKWVDDTCFWKNRIWKLTQIDRTKIVCLDKLTLEIPNADISMHYVYFMLVWELVFMWAPSPTTHTRKWIGVCPTLAPIDSSSSSSYLSHQSGVGFHIWI